VTLPQTPVAAPNRVPWPPLIVAGLAVAAFTLGRLLPLGRSVLSGEMTAAVGVAVIVAALGLDLAAMLTMRRQRANILPHRAATALVTTGPFAMSRNPIYLGNTLLLAGAGLLLGNAWFLAASGVGVWLVTRLAIVREEAHLAVRFGEAWVTYAEATPRWLRLFGWRVG
jgi:protein-S-isoprenylcysteine O-methyltransferase Ste14